MKLGSWSFTYDRLRFHLTNNISSTIYKRPNHTWKIKANYAVSNIVHYHSGAFQDMKFAFILARNPNQYVMTIVITCLFLVLISGLTFIVPCSSGERLSAVLAIVVAISVYQMVAMDILPKGADSLPILSYFVAIELYLVFFCVIITMISLWIEGEKHPFRPNRWVYHFFVTICGTPCFIRRTGEWKELKENFGDLKDIGTDHLTREETLKLRKLEWSCFKKAMEALSMVIYWVAFFTSMIVIVIFGFKRDDQMEGEFDRLFNEEDGLVYT